MVKYEEQDGEAVAMPLPSWLRWPPNCCEVCRSWQDLGNHIGRCEDGKSTHAGDETDSRFRCQNFYRKS